MPRENAAEKAVRYLREGRLVIELVHSDRIQATCRGDGRIHHIDVIGGDWRCDCDARGRCSHLLAVGCVVAVKERS